MPSPTIPSVTQTITPPLATDDRATFDAKAFAAWQDLGVLAPQLNAFADAIEAVGNFAEAEANIAETAASNAQAARDAAQSFANASVWNAGTAYTLGQIAISPINWRVYRRIIPGTTGTDPSADATNWTLAAGNLDTTGNAATATALQTARLIGGVSFNGTANINLPGVNSPGNQNTSGNAATVTTLNTTQTLAATAGAAVGAVGTYALCQWFSSQLNPGDTVPGGALNYVNAGSGGGVNVGSGTWRCMGFIPTLASGSQNITLFLRIS